MKTYAELLVFLEGLTPDQLKSNISLYSKEVDEFYPVTSFTFTEEPDVLDENHPILQF